MYKILLLTLSAFLLFSCVEDSPTKTDLDPEPDKTPVFSLVSEQTEVTGKPGEIEINFYLKIMNETDFDIDFSARVIMEDLYEGHSATICWGSIETGGICYEPHQEDFETMEDNLVRVEANLESPMGAFIGYLLPNNLEGVSKVRIEIFNRDFPEVVQSKTFEINVEQGFGI